MMIVKNYVAPSKIHGVGLFAGEDIQCGRKIFVLNDRTDIVMSKSSMHAYGSEFVRFMIIFAYEDFYTHDMYISVDNSRFMNHSSDPNTEWDRKYGWATRFISNDEEITCDYHTFWCNAPFADPRE
jgi:SET domain-containing protein